MAGKKGNEGVNQIIKIALFLLVLGFVFFGGSTLLYGKINFYKWLGFGDENKTIEGVGIVGYDIARNKAQYFDGKAWIDLLEGEKIRFKGEDFTKEKLDKDFADYFYGKGDYDDLRREIVFAPDSQCSDSYIVGFERNYDADGEIFGSSYSAAQYGHIILKEVESKDDEKLLGEQKYLDYFLITLDGKIRERNNVDEFSFYEGVGASPESKYPFAFNVGRVIDERVVEIDDWILEGKISNDAKKVRLTPDLAFDLKKINGIYLITEYGPVKKEERITIRRDVQAKMLDPENYQRLAFYQEYIYRYDLRDGIELRLFFLDIMSEWGRQNCDNYEFDRAKIRCDVIYQFYIDGRPVEAWYKVSRNRENGEFSNSIFVSNDIWEKGSRYSDYPISDLGKCELSLVNEAKKWRDGIYENPVKLGENYYCVFRVVGEQIVVKLEEKTDKEARCRVEVS